MPAYSKEKTEYHKEKIRQAMIILGPNASQQDVVDFLTKNRLPLDRHYVAKLQEKLIKEGRLRLDKKIVSEYFAAYEDTLNELARRCWRIILNEDRSMADELRAIKELREAKFQILRTVIDTGLVPLRFENNKINGEIKLGSKEQQNIDETIDRVAARWALQFGPKPKPVIYDYTKPLGYYEKEKEKEPEKDEPKEVKSEQPKPEPKPVHPNQKIIDAQRIDNPYIG